MAEAVVAQTLTDALVEVYANNPRLQSERARLRATDEQVPQALSKGPLLVGVDTSAGPHGGRARSNVAATRESVLSTEQEVLEDVVTAFSTVVREQAVLELNRSNERVLAQNLEATSNRFRAGELTRTDVSQAEARFARATADRIQAEGDLGTARAAFKNVVGFEPGKLVITEELGGLRRALENAREDGASNRQRVTAGLGVPP